jgi:hypothetical protein
MRDGFKSKRLKVSPGRTNMGSKPMRKLTDAQVYAINKARFEENKSLRWIMAEFKIGEVKLSKTLAVTGQEYQKLKAKLQIDCDCVVCVFGLAKGETNVCEPRNNF